MYCLLSPTEPLRCAAALIGALLFLLPLLPAQTDSLFRGTWEGQLQVGPQSLQLFFTLQTDEAGHWTCLLDVPQQNATNIAAKTVDITGQQVRINYPLLNAQYEGHLDPEPLSIRGTWTQNGQGFPLQLQLAQADALPEAPPRPQTPQPPFPYTSEPLSFVNPLADSIRLAGTLTLPPGPGPFPTAILISGSGPQNRDEEILGHQPFWIIADYLSRRGIAVYRYDDRGVAESEGNFRLATTKDFASDARAAFQHLQQDPRIAADHIGFIGHSEGGIVAPMVASEQRDVAFLILLAAPGVPLADILQTQAILIARAEGVPEDIIQRDSSFNAQVFSVIRGQAEEAAQEEALMSILERAYAALSEEERAGVGSLYAFQTKTIANLRTPWMKFLLPYNPRQALEQVHCPVLALNGDKDLQVSIEQNLPEIGAALELGPCTDFSLQRLEGLNHLFQYSETGQVSEYGKLEETFSETALERMAQWLGKRFGTGTSESD